MQIPFLRKKRKAPEYNSNKVYTSNFSDKQRKVIQDQEKRNLKDRWVYAAIFIIIILCILIVLFRADRFQIHGVEIQTTQNINKTQIEYIVNGYLAQKSLFLFRKSNKYLFSTDEVGELIRENLQDQVVIKSLEINLSDQGDLSLNIKEQLPNIIWQTGDMPYLMDFEGVITSRDNQIEDENATDKFLPKIVDENNLPVEINQQVISKDLVDFVVLLTEEFPKQVSNDLQIDYFEIPEIKCQQRIIQSKETNVESEVFNQELDDKKRVIQERFKNNEISIDESLELLENLRREYILSNQSALENGEIDELVKIEYEEIFEDFPCSYIQTIKDIKLVTTEGWYIYLTTYLDFTTQAENLNTVLKENITNHDNLEYIDVRFDDRVYIK